MVGTNPGPREIDAARAKGTSESVVREHALKYYERLLRDDPDADRFLRNQEIDAGDAEKEIKTRVYKDLLRERPDAYYCAEYLYGKDSEEYRQAVAVEKERTAKRKQTGGEAKKDSWELITDTEGFRTARLDPEATVGDFLEALAGENSEEDTALYDRFWMEVHDNFPPEIADAFLDASKNPELRNMKFADFLKRLGIPESDASVFLPIAFAKKKRR